MEDPEGRPPCEGVDRNAVIRYIIQSQEVALHVRAWIEITARNAARHQRKSRPPCEGVDRNRTEEDIRGLLNVALHVRAWVEI